MTSNWNSIGLELLVVYYGHPILASCQRKCLAYANLALQHEHDELMCNRVWPDLLIVAITLCCMYFNQQISPKIVIEISQW